MGLIRKCSSTNVNCDDRFREVCRSRNSVVVSKMRMCVIMRPDLRPLDDFDNTGRYFQIVLQEPGEQGGWIWIPE
jgi:hypothetical protein